MSGELENRLVKKSDTMGVRSVVIKTSSHSFITLSQSSVVMLPVKYKKKIMEVLDQVLGFPVTVFCDTSIELRGFLTEFISFPYVSGLLHCIIIQILSFVY